MFHECVKMIEAYHLMLFSNAYSSKVQLGAGNSFFIVMLVLVAVNLILAGTEMIAQANKKLKRNKLIKAKEA